VQTLVGGRTYPAGTHQVLWDGRNAGGQSVASGVYLYRLNADGVVQTKRMVLMK
jgi:flagellar hook assembly protein FlgD